jgi:branched-subunit amino acid aminotransferase/4-amino-4-deoxychorismate lyase
MECLKELLRLERGWLPEREGYSLYIRPFMFGSSHSLGISRPTRSTIAIMLSPVGPYFQTGAGLAVAQHVHSRRTGVLSRRGADYVFSACAGCGSVLHSSRCWS